MNDHTQVSAQHKPKSLLQAHQEAETLTKAPNEFAESQETPPSTVESPPEPPEDLIPEVTSNTIANANAKPKSNRGAPLTRRKPPVHSEQPSIPHLLELGVKVRDFGYENPLPPVPTVYLQPRQIQPSVPKDVNDPNDPHYVLEEERKKKVYSFASTRKIERTPTEPLIESDLLPPPRREFPKIKRTDAQLDLGSQPPSYSPPPPPPHSLLHDTINESSESQPLPGLTMDSQPADQWVDTPIATPHGSHQWAAMSPSVTDTSAVPASQQLDSSDSQAPPMPELLSYSQMGFSHPASPQSQSPLRADSGHRAPLSSSHTRSRHQEGLGSSPGMGGHVSPMRRPLTPNSPLNPRCRNDGDRGRVESHSPRHSPLAVVRSQLSSSSSSSPSRQPHGSLSPAPVPLMIPSSPIPRYNFRTKRRAESPAPTSHSEHPSTRPRLTRSVAARIALSSNTVKPPVSIKSAHAQGGGGGGASKATTSTGRTLRKSSRAVTIPAPVPERDTRSSRRRK